MRATGHQGPQGQSRSVSWLSGSSELQPSVCPSISHGAPGPVLAPPSLGRGSVCHVLHVAALQEFPDFSALGFLRR